MVTVYKLKIHFLFCNPLSRILFSVVSPGFLFLLLFFLCPPI